MPGFTMTRNLAAGSHRVETLSRPCDEGDVLEVPQALDVSSSESPRDRARPRQRVAVGTMTASTSALDSL